MLERVLCNDNDVFKQDKDQGRAQGSFRTMTQSVTQCRDATSDSGLLNLGRQLRYVLYFFCKENMSCYIPLFQKLCCLLLKPLPIHISQKTFDIANICVHMCILLLLISEYRIKKPSGKKLDSRQSTLLINKLINLF